MSTGCVYTLLMVLVLLLLLLLLLLLRRCISHSATSGSAQAPPTFILITSWYTTPSLYLSLYRYTSTVSFVILCHPKFPSFILYPFPLSLERFSSATDAREDHTSAFSFIHVLAALVSLHFHISSPFLLFILFLRFFLIYILAFIYTLLYYTFSHGIFRW